MRVTDAITSRAAASTGRLAAQLRRYAALDARIQPTVFHAPDLSTRQARAAAARAGVDLSSPASIDAGDARYAAAQAGADTG